MFIKSKISGEEFTSIKDFNLHLRKHKICQKDYCLQYEKRVCMQTGHPIEYKNLEQYLTDDFINKIEMRKWFKENPEKAVLYSRELLEKRKKSKGLVYAMGETELRSLYFPRIKYYNSKFAGYNKLNLDIGLKTKFDYNKDFATNPVKESEIIIDTREQTLIKYKGAAREKLEYGDYALASNRKISIERKNLQDLISTVVTQLERFEKEIIRAKEDGGYLIILCELDINTALSFDHIPHYKKYTRIKPQVMFHNIRELCQKYDNIQFAFANGRPHMKEVIQKILGCGESIRQYDLQYLIQEKII